jgi:hypothetical protein
MTFNEILSVIVPIIALFIIIFIPAKWGKPITWLQDLGKYPQSNKKVENSPKTKTYRINISLDESHKK